MEICDVKKLLCSGPRWSLLAVTALADEAAWCQWWRRTWHRMSRMVAESRSKRTRV
jgi:hypothetical protein